MTSAPTTDREPLTDRGRRRRDALLVAAREVFEQQGFTATRMGDIAAAAGVSHSRGGSTIRMARRSLQ